MQDASRRALERVRRLVFVLASVACGAGDPEPAVLHLGEDSVVLAPGARITDVHLRARAARAEFLPEDLEAGPGDVLRFSAEDGGPHALVFDRVLTDETAFAFVTATGQQRSLPLTEPGDAWIVSFADAPTGRYGVRCLTHGTTFHVSVAVPTGR